ncbi:MAG TPA: ribonuclease HII [Rhizomicrobium sp.]|jgi:ribonuclease HII
MPHYIYESRFLKTMPGPIAGVDEAGRGPLAGPVVAAAVILDRKKMPKGLNDSKQLDVETREELYAVIVEKAVAWGVGIGSVDEIDLINIRQATHLAMARAVRELKVAAMFALVDGNDAPALPCPCDTIIDGDAKSVSIAAASIIAKVTRDRMMRTLHYEHPHYGWFNNKGYGTPDHYAGLEKHGPCPHHRRSFGPIHNMLYPQDPVTQDVTL